MDLAAQVMARFHRQRVQRDPGVTPTAMAAAMDWVARMPSDPRPLWCRGALWLQLRDVERAIDDVTRAIVLAHDRPAALERGHGLLTDAMARFQPDDPRVDELEAAAKVLEEMKP